MTEPRSPEDEMEAVRGIAMMGAGDWSEEKKLAAFMAIFHPEREPLTHNEARKMRDD